MLSRQLLQPTVIWVFLILFFVFSIYVLIVDCMILDFTSLQGELWGWACFFIGVAAVGVGSSYYHLEPNDARLVWDRLPVSFTE